MKRFLRLVVLMVSFFGMFPVFSADQPQDQLGAMQEQKIYVASEQLGLSPEGIFVFVDHQWVKRDALFHDEKGMYIWGLRPEDNECPKGYERCRNCGRCVKRFYDICPHCERPV
jgi:hypothetical protein